MWKSIKLFWYFPGVYLGETTKYFNININEIGLIDRESPVIQNFASEKLLSFICYQIVLQLLGRCTFSESVNAFGADK